MSNPPQQADDCKKLLDNGWVVTLYLNQLGSYTAEADRGTCELDTEQVVTGDFEPSKALYRLTEKVFGNIV